MLLILYRLNVYFKKSLNYVLQACNYYEEVIPDPIPNSEVKLFSANSTLS